MNVHRYLQQQFTADSVEEIDAKVAMATKISVQTVRSIKKQAALCHPLPIASPPQRVMPHTVMNCYDNFDLDFIRK